MTFYERHVVPYLVELGCGMAALRPLREGATRELEGTVLEIGFGSGLNVPHYPDRVTKVLAVDPSATARRIGRARIARARCAIEDVGLEAERIACGDACADSALSTFTLCTVADPALALAEVKRVLKPGGRFHFVEHGRAPDRSVARWQDRLNGVQRSLCGGCHLNREIDALIARAGFRIESLEQTYLVGPKTHSYVYAGTATPN